jgi:Ala-tRNA(Pro) deacylase
MPATKIKEYLDKNRIKYEVITHPLAYTAQGVAAAAHVAGKDVAKTVIVKIDGKPVMAVLPAPRRLDLQELRKVAGTDSVELATEQEFADIFPDCEPGAEPPFGNLYGIDTIVSDALTEDEQIAFNAGTHTECIRLAYRDYAKLVRPKVAHIAT